MFITKKFCFVLAALLLFMTAAPVCFAGASGDGITIQEISKYGNLILTISGTDFMALGYEFGDIVTVAMDGAEYDMPVGSNYSDVDNGNMICRVKIDPESDEDIVTLAISMGDMATDTGIAVKKDSEEAEEGFVWEYTNESKASPVISFCMKEKGGYEAEYQLRQLERTNERGDYEHLDDEQFANFRAVATSGMGQGALYRSSSPVNPELGRNEYADAALKEAGVRTVVNLADTSETLSAHPGYSQSAYSQCACIALGLSVDVLAEDFRLGLADGLRFMAEGEGPYLVHCTEGKDRAGFVSALLECLMGASADEVMKDYMVTYYNYYGVEPGTEQYEKIARSNICSIMAEAFGVEDIFGEGIDLAAEAAEYIENDLGLSKDEIEILRTKLSAAY